MLASLAGGCARPQTSDPPIRKPARAAVILFVDGLDRLCLNRLLAAGELPNIARYFEHGGLRVEHAVDCIPSLTYPNAVSLITGRFPGHHGIVGNQWFDRTTLRMPDYIRPAFYRDVNEHFAAPTLFEILGDCFTVNIQCHSRRGVSATIDNLITTGIGFSVGSPSSVDANVAACMGEVTTLARRAGTWPTVILAYFPGVDEVGHHQGPDSRRYHDEIRVVDRAIGEIVASVAAAGMQDSTCFVLATDHNHVQIPDGRAWSISDWLRARGRRLQTRPIDDLDFQDRLARVEHDDTVLINGTYRAAQIHLRGPGGWLTPADPAELRRLIEARPALVDMPAVELLLIRAEVGRARIESRHGSALIERRYRDGVPEYRVVERRGTPLREDRSAGLEAFIRAGWHSSREWLEATADLEYPDLAPQAVDLFDSPHTGDIVLFAADDWAFGVVGRGEHGSCLARDRTVPLYFSGPGLAAGARIRYARLVDIMPTVVDLLGAAERLGHAPGLDGQSLRPALEAASTAHQRSAGATRVPPADSR